MVAGRTVSVGIVGAGPGGLAAAMLLAAGGARVRVYESEARVGGRTARLTLPASNGGGEFHFDRGPTFFLMPFVLEEIFAAAGKRLTDHAELTRLDPMYRLAIGQRDGERGGRGDDIAIDCTQRLDAMREQIDRISPGDGRAFEAFLQENRSKLAAFTPVLRRAFRGPADLFGADMIKAAPLLHPLQSVAAQLERRFKHPAVRLALSFQSKYLGMSPHDCPSLFTILPFIEYEYGVWHPTGGCNALMDAMATAAADMGVQVRCSTRVHQVAFEGRKAVGVQLHGPDGPMERHDHVVMNADAAWALRNLVPEPLRPSGLKDAALDAKKYSCSTFMLHLGVRGPVDLPHHTISISSRYRENLDDIGEGRLSEEPSLYICNPSRIDPSLAPRGDSSLYVLAPTANLKHGGAIAWEREAAGVRAKVLARVSELAGVDIQKRIVAEKAVTPRDWAASGIHFGATFNLAHNLRQMLFLRPQHRVQGMDNLWLVGGGTHPGSGLPVIFLSAQITARLLCAESGLPDPLRGETQPRRDSALQRASSLAGATV